MIEYKVGDSTYSVSYLWLREDYHRYCAMTDKQFLKNIAGALHLACIICWFKEMGSDYVLGDQGIIHELVHIIHIGMKDPCMQGELPRIRANFARDLELK